MNSRSSSMYRASKGASSSGSKEGIQQRIAQKQQEYESLLQLKTQSDSLLRSMQDLETKLDTLNGGTEAVASVLSNWASVFKAINVSTVKMQEARGDGDESAPENDMPETLVRISTEKS
ncbi:Putative uncharacterized protein [Taphrina deformans PYCC 5710]|uniref:DASH complex subunit DAD2 n=1 Tax=Taphrina deformans (strain PYCC 5710 / ATCC 11124 / CBS 356.35 / IMI 108563 / JCM 9778 / NBRC 8474) TaxID=1097556 RepID=R4XCU6_TAPDE|nr:Putative uncharacterized protein [Taphrina deformans PYCC 5710]|eukprot:CCG82233.1 Putative uncharacterized protein [Taphrina deformans PYCC 5710]